MEQNQKKKTSKPYSPVALQCIGNAREGEFRERAVRLAMEHRDDYQSEAVVLTAITGKLGCSPDSLRVWMRQIQRDGGERPGQTSAEKARSDPLEAPLVRAQWRTNLNAKCVNFGRPMRSCAKLLRIWPSPLSRFEDKPLPGSGSSTARFANDCFH